MTARGTKLEKSVTIVRGIRAARDPGLTLYIKTPLATRTVRNTSLTKAFASTRTFPAATPAEGIRAARANNSVKDTVP